MLHHICVKSEKCQSVLGEAVNYSGDDALVNLMTLVKFREAKGAIWKTLHKHSQMPMNDVQVAMNIQLLKGMQEAEIFLSFQIRRKEKTQKYGQTREMGISLRNR